MKKTLLITIHDLDAGGAQKSLVSFLNTLPEDIYDISLMVVNFRGIFISQIPVNVKVIEVPAWVKAMMTPLSSGEFWKGRMALFGPLKVFSILGATLFRNRKNASKNQYTWAFWKRFFRRSEQSFDIAMSYMDGFCNYYVIDKVKANKKVLWVHNDYSKLSAVARFD